MNRAYLLIIIALFSINLKLLALDFSVGEYKEVTTDEFKALYDKWALANPGVSIDDFNKMQNDVAPCSHCAAPYALLNKVRSILKKMPNAENMPQIGELELQYAVAQINSPSGPVCGDLITTYDDQFQKVRFDGQFEQIAEGVFDKYSSIAMLTYRGENSEAAIYYYRDKNNQVVQVVVDKEGKASFKIYKYKAKKDSSYAGMIPDISTMPPAPKPVAESKIFPEKLITKPMEPLTPSGFIDGHASGSFHADWGERGGVLSGYIPKDVTLGDAAAGVRIGQTKVNGTLKSTLASGHKVELVVDSQDDTTGAPYMKYSAETTVDGKFKEQSIIIPVKLSIGTIGVDGEVVNRRGSGVGNHHQDMVMSFFEPVVEGQEGPRKEYVTMRVSKAEGQGITYDLGKTFDSGENIFTTNAGKDQLGNYVGVAITPKRNRNEESIMIKLVDESGKVTGYATYTRAF